MNNINELNILIVDDKPEGLLVFKGLLEKMECNIIGATMEEEVLNLIQKHEFALVLLSIQMPYMNGFEIAELVRSNPKTGNLPIILINSIDKEQKYIFKGYENGAVDYLVRPIEPILLQSKVKLFLEFYKQRKLLEYQDKLLELRLRELQELKEENLKLESLSASDGLTGIPNRRSFDSYISMSLKSCTRSEKPISLIMADIDSFKAYNDNYGHLKGDECLIKVARAISASIKRPLDFLARYGGEEFAVVLPETDEEGAIIIAERIQENIASLAIPHEYSTTSPYITLSLGIATILPGEDYQVNELIDYADKALYEVKSNGRNQIRINRK